MSNHYKKIKVELYKELFVHNTRMLFDVFYSLHIIDRCLNTDSKPIYDLVYILEKGDMSNDDKYKHDIVNSFITFLHNNKYGINSLERFEENMWTTINKSSNDVLHTSLEIFINQLQVKEKRALNVFMTFVLSLLEEIEILESTCDEL